ncbi:MAG TPA: hypothetical protein VEW28_10165 [Candidatus Kapabacteria bacterium]|nr:hypothetical protein [Candidatus Kapabacteria bacterium]
MFVIGLVIQPFKGLRTDPSYGHLALKFHGYYLFFDAPKGDGPDEEIILMEMACLGCIVTWSETISKIGWNTRTKKILIATLSAVGLSILFPPFDVLTPEHWYSTRSFGGYGFLLGGYSHAVFGARWLVPEVSAIFLISAAVIKFQFKRTPNVAAIVNNTMIPQQENDTQNLPLQFGV